MFSLASSVPLICKRLSLRCILIGVSLPTRMCQVKLAADNFVSDPGQFEVNCCHPCGVYCRSQAALNDHLATTAHCMVLGLTEDEVATCDLCDGKRMPVSATEGYLRHPDRLKNEREVAWY
ncbi:hypothetical protein BC940DRAFT_337425 [Gongronella butleri]|nr:hypothetical protein BC940DRAFT_337425 [Gongronella butleri]